MAFSVDTIFDRYFEKPHISEAPDYSPDKAVVDCNVSTRPDSDQLVVVIPPWHANQAVQDQLAYRQRQAGRSVLSYVLHDDILTTDTDRTIASFEAIGERIVADVSHIDVPRKHFIAASLGTAILPFILGEHGIRARASLVTPGGDLATNLWTGIRTQHLRQAFEADGINLTDLQNVWRRLSPTYQAQHNIRGCDFKMYASMSDLVIRPETIDTYVKTLRSTGNKVHFQANKFLGHYGTILRRSLIGTL